MSPMCEIDDMTLFLDQSARTVCSILIYQMCEINVSNFSLKSYTGLPRGDLCLVDVGTVLVFCVVPPDAKGWRVLLFDSVLVCAERRLCGGHIYHGVAQLLRAPTVLPHASAAVAAPKGWKPRRGHDEVF